MTRETYEGSGGPRRSETNTGHSEPRLGITSSAERVHRTNEPETDHESRGSSRTEPGGEIPKKDQVSVTVLKDGTNKD